MSYSSIQWRRMIAVVCGVVGVSGCASTFDFRPVDTSGIIKPESRESLDCATKAASSVRTEYYKAAGELANSNQMFDIPSLAAAALSVGSIAFGGTPELTLGAGLAGGAIQGTKAYYSPTARAKIYLDGANALSCVINAARVVEPAVDRFSDDNKGQLPRQMLPGQVNSVFEILINDSNRTSKSAPGDVIESVEQIRVLTEGRLITMVHDVQFAQVRDDFVAATIASAQKRAEIEKLRDRGVGAANDNVDAANAVALIANDNTKALADFRAQLLACVAKIPGG